MSHLGERTSAYVDGRLTGAGLARAEAHLASCDRCALQVAAERELAARLRGLGPAPPPADLTDRIRSAAPQPASPGWQRAGRRAVDVVSMPSWRHRAAVRTAVGGGIAVAAVGGVLVLGTLDGTLLPAPAVLSASEGDEVALPVAALRVVDSTDAAIGALREEGWALPAELPADLHVTGVTRHEIAGREVVEIEVVGSGGSARLLEVRGAIDDAGLPDGAVVVQCDGIAVVVTGDLALRDRLATLLGGAFDASPAGRFDRGVQVIVSFVREVAP